MEWVFLCKSLLAAGLPFGPVEVRIDTYPLIPWSNMVRSLALTCVLLDLALF